MLSPAMFHLPIRVRPFKKVFWEHPLNEGAYRADSGDTILFKIGQCLTVGLVE